MCFLGLKNIFDPQKTQVNLFSKILLVTDFPHLKHLYFTIF